MAVLPDDPRVPVIGAHLERQNLLLLLSTHHAAQARPAGWVLVLRVRFVVGQEVIHRITALLPLLLGIGIHLHPGVDGLAARLDESRDGKIRLMEDGNLLIAGLLIKLNKYMAISRDRGIRTIKVIWLEWIDTNPSALLGLLVVLLALGVWAEEAGDPFGSREEVALAGREVLTVIILPSLIGDADHLVVLERGEQEVGRADRYGTKGNLGYALRVEHHPTIRANRALLLAEPTLRAFVRLHIGVVQFVAQILLSPGWGAMREVPLLKQRPRIVPTQFKAVGEDARRPVCGWMSTLSRDSGR